MNFITRLDITGALKNFVWVNVEIDSLVESIDILRLRVGEIFDLERSWVDQSVFSTTANIGIVKNDMALVLT